jgi:hypothetical protein
VIVFETALEPRLYVDPSVVRTDMLRRTDPAATATTRACDVPGWSATPSSTMWRTHEDPPPECHPSEDISASTRPSRRGRRCRSRAAPGCCEV